MQQKKVLTICSLPTLPYTQQQTNIKNPAIPYKKLSILRYQMRPPMRENRHAAPANSISPKITPPTKKNQFRSKIFRCQCTAEKSRDHKHHQFHSPSGIFQIQPVCPAISLQSATQKFSHLSTVPAYFFLRFFLIHQHLSPFYITL